MVSFLGLFKVGIYVIRIYSVSNIFNGVEGELSKYTLQNNNC